MKKEMINAAIAACMKNLSTKVKITIKGWQQSSEYKGGINPWCDDATCCGVIIESSEPSLVGKIIKTTYHGSYNGVYRSWKFLSKMEDCPKENYFSPAENLHEAGTQHSWIEGTFQTHIRVQYQYMPCLEIWRVLKEQILDKIQRAIDTREKPGVKVGFLNWGYKRPEIFEEYPYIPSSVEMEHYHCGCLLTVASFYSQKEVDYTEIYDILREEMV